MYDQSKGSKRGQRRQWRQWGRIRVCILVGIPLWVVVLLFRRSTPSSEPPPGLRSSLAPQKAAHMEAQLQMERQAELNEALEWSREELRQQKDRVKELEAENLGLLQREEEQLLALNDLKQKEAELADLMAAQKAAAGNGLPVKPGTGPPLEKVAKGVLPGIPSIPRSPDDIHIIFSTDCSGYQNWQSFLLFHSAMNVGQPGRMTRLASGCTDEERRELERLHSVWLPDRFSLHFTPDFSIFREGKRFPYANKPNAVSHFLQHASPPINDTVLALLDPDMILLTSLKSIVDPVAYPLSLGRQSPLGKSPFWVQEGQPASQIYLIGAKWTQFPTLRDIVKDDSSPALRVSTQDALDHYAAGPPYLLHTRDWVKVAASWADFMMDVYDADKTILADMYAYSIAAAHHSLPNTLVAGWMISNDMVSTSSEGWGGIDQLEPSQICQAFSSPSTSLPALIHYCQFYRLGLHMWGKRRPELHRIFSCEGEGAFTVLEPPMELPVERVAFSDHVGEERGVHVEQVGDKEARRRAFMICYITRSLNAALQSFRSSACTPGQALAAQQNNIQLTRIPVDVLQDEEWLRGKGVALLL